MISAVNLKPISRRNKPTRRARGERPRGPKPQVCDLCQLRKAKCDRELPRCSLCLKSNRPCTYDRNGFGKPTSQSPESKPERLSDLVTDCKSPVSRITRLSAANKHLLIHSVVHHSILAKKRSHVIIEADGNFFYVGPSIATHYVTRNHKLLSSISQPFVTNYEPIVYNGSIPVEFTHTLNLQLIELYFAYVNAFYPVVDPSQFYSNFNQGCSTPSFKALLSVICLSGASFYPNRTFGRIIAIHFAKQATERLRKIILTPSIQAVQAFLIASFHISVCEEKTVIEGAWFAMGIAKNMAALLGIPKSPLGDSRSNRDLRHRLAWMICSTDIVISHCCGRPLSDSVTLDIPLPSYNALLPGVNFTCPSVFLVPDVISCKSQSNQNYFRNFCGHMQLVARRIKLQEQYEEQDRRWNSKGSLSNILNSTTSSSRPYLVASLKLERQFINWYQSLPGIGPKTRRSTSSLYLPSSTDIHMSMLAIFFFSSLVDLNKPFISEESQVSNLPFGRSLDLAYYLSSSPLEKCIVATFYGYQVIFDAGDLVLEVGLPYLWYAALQFTLIFVYIAHRLPPSHWAVPPAIQNATFLFAHFERNADRWALIRDTYFMLKPYVKLLTLQKPIQLTQDQ